MTSDLAWQRTGGELQIGTRFAFSVRQVVASNTRV